MIRLSNCGIPTNSKRQIPKKQTRMIHLYSYVHMELAREILDQFITKSIMMKTIVLFYLNSLEISSKTKFLSKRYQKSQRIQIIFNHTIFHNNTVTFLLKLLFDLLRMENQIPIENESPAQNLAMQSNSLLEINQESSISKPEHNQIRTLTTFALVFSEKIQNPQNYPILRPILNVSSPQQYPQQQNNQIINHQILADRAKLLAKAANILEDSENEGDEYYATVRSIYTYFNHTHSILTILNAIHRAAGDVSLAVKRLSQLKVSFDNNQFLYTSIAAPAENLEQYFSY